MTLQSANLMPTKAPREKTLTPDWISVSQAARELGIAHGTVLARAMNGVLETTQFAGRIWISRASVNRAKAKVAQ